MFSCGTQAIRVTHLLKWLPWSWRLLLQNNQQVKLLAEQIDSPKASWRELKNNSGESTSCASAQYVTPPVAAFLLRHFQAPIVLSATRMWLNAWLKFPTHKPQLWICGASKSITLLTEQETEHLFNLLGSCYVLVGQSKCWKNSGPQRSGGGQKLVFFKMWSIGQFSLSSPCRGFCLQHILQCPRVLCNGQGHWS